MVVNFRAVPWILAAWSTFGQAEPNRFMAKPLAQLLEFTGSRCAYQAEVEEVIPGKETDYTFVVKAKQLKAWGEQSQVDFSMTRFQVAHTTNLRANRVPSHVGGDFYRDSISVEKLNVGARYLFLCNERVFEAIADTPENIYKVELLLKFNWEKQYPRQASIQQLGKDLADPDLYVLAYNELARRKRLSDQVLEENMDGIAGVRLLRLHLASLGRRGQVNFEPQPERVQLRTRKQMDFVRKAFDRLIKNDLVALELDRMITTPAFYTTLDQPKAELFNMNLARMRKDMKQYGEVYYKLLVKFAKALGIKGNQAFAAEFSDDYRILTLAAKADSRVPRLYLRLLEEKEAKAFLVRLLASLNQMAGDVRFTKKAVYVAAILDKEMPRYPSAAYLSLLEQFDPYELSTMIQDDNQLREEFRYKAVSETKRDLNQVFIGTSMVVGTLTSIMEKEPRSAERAHKIGSRFIAPGREIVRYLPKDLVNQYVAAYNKSKNLVSGQ